MAATTLFLVTSHGYTATKWLAWALNTHPQIYCNHSAGSEVLDRDYTRKELADLADAKSEPREHEPLTSVLDQLAARGQGTAAGNVHRYNLTALRRIAAQHPQTTSFRSLNLIREPAPWVASGSSQLAGMFATSPLIRWRLRRSFAKHQSLHRDAGVPLFPTPSDLAFCYLCTRLQYLAAEIHLEAVRHVRMEELTSKPQVFCSVVHQLTGIHLDLGDPLVERIFCRGPIHRHSKVASKPPNWSPWQLRVFHHWAAKTEILKLYSDVGYPPLTLPSIDRSSARSSSPPPPRRFKTETTGSPVAARVPGSAGLGQQIRSAYEATFDAVKSQPMTLGRWLEKPLRRVLTKLHQELAREGLGELLRDSQKSFMSPSLQAGAPPRLHPSFFSDTGESWRVTVCHPPMHDRSPALAVVRPTTRTTYFVNLKGAGLRSPNVSFLYGRNRYPGHRQATERRQAGQPLDVLVDNPDRSRISHKLVGGALLVPSLFEMRNALAWHRLLFHLDGQAAATCIPLRICRLRQLVVRSFLGVSPTALATWDYFTHPKLLNNKQLERVTNDVSLLSTRLSPMAFWRIRKLKRLVAQTPPTLSKETLTDETIRPLRRTVGELYLRDKGPVVYEHVTMGKLRIGHVWDLIAADEHLEQHLTELRLTEPSQNIPHVVTSLLTEIYGTHGQRLKEVDTRDVNWTTPRGRFAYLRALYRANLDNAEAIMKAVGNAAGRTLGALHGTGGHGLGRRIKVRDRNGRPLREASGLTRRMGAAGGGCTAKRNITICGEFVDTGQLFNPWGDIISRLAHMLSPLFASLEWAHPRHVPTFQRCDLELAEESMVLFSSLMTGELSQVPADFIQIETLRRTRNSLEDELPAADDRRSDRVKEIDRINREIGRLRFSLPEVDDAAALLSFRKIYRDTYQRATPSPRTVGATDPA